ncbi:acylphosphatase [Lacipirellula parvula]|uniref:acylphosphatase n=1 Tax=Lacipirellula parvula TaxID=2650471 RepID=A0A5K7X950_9BACT|nr:acylphosphatase [Lacipirellula parvula]BBO32417.1 hypothetical protein PLANPX_2029 [Lacipirellula parvula]
MPAHRPTSLQRRQAIYTGHVQGVGFRETTRRLAEGFEVTGFIKNLPDGRVELIAEGFAGELDRFLAAVAERMEGRIRNVAVDVRPALGEFADFRIRH